MLSRRPGASLSARGAALCYLVPVALVRGKEKWGDGRGDSGSRPPWGCLPRPRSRGLVRVASTAWAPRVSAHTRESYPLYTGSGPGGTGGERCRDWAVRGPGLWEEGPVAWSPALGSPCLLMGRRLGLHPLGRPVKTAVHTEASAGRPCEWTSVLGMGVGEVCLCLTSLRLLVLPAGLSVCLF